MQHEPRRFDNPGMPPSKWGADTKVRVVFANGRPSLHAYPVSALRWDLAGDAWDIASFWKDT
jgi:hypothetical protein